MGRIKIAFDIDGCIVDLMALLLPIIERRTKISTQGECYAYDLETVYGVQDDDLYDCLHITYQYWDDIPVYKGVEELFHKLYEKTKDPLYFVTNRKLRWSYETYKLMERICKDIPFIIAFTESVPKSIFLKNYPYFVEDRIRNIKELKEAGKFVFVPKQPYNKETTFGSYTHRINSIKDLIPLVHLFIGE